MRSIDLDRLDRILLDIHSDLQHQANQSILKRDPSVGLAALGGMDALTRLRNQLAMECPEFSLLPQKAAPMMLRPLRGKLR